MNTNNYQQNQKGNGGLIAILAALCVTVAAALIVALLFLTGVISTSKEEVPPAPVQETSSAATSTTQNGTATQTTQPQTTTMYVANVDYSIYFRTAPIEDNGNIITEILYGTPVTYIEQADAVFAKIRYNGQEGYVKREYLSTTVPPAKSSSAKASSSSYMTVVGVKNSIYLRYRPSDAIDGNVICEIPVGSTVRFISSGNGEYYEIEWGGMVGYGTAKYLR